MPISLKPLRNLRDRLGTLWWYTLLSFVASRMGDVINLFIGLYLVPRLLPGTDLGALLPLMSIGTLFSIPLAILLLPVDKFLSVFAARSETGKVKALLTDSLLVSTLFAVGVTVWVFSRSEALLTRLQVSDTRLLWPIAGFAVLVCIEPVVGAAGRALQYFKAMLISGALAPYVRLAAMLVLLAPLGAAGYLMAQFVTSVFGLLLGIGVLFYFLRGMGRRRSYWMHGREMVRYALPLLVLAIVGRIVGPVESLVIRQRLPLVDSAGYYYAVMLGNIPGYFSGAVLPFLWAIVSDRFERGLNTGRMLLHTMLFNFAVGAVFIVLFALCMPWFFTLPGPWRPYGMYAGYVWQAALISVLKMANVIFTSHETACRRFIFMWYLVPLMLVEGALLYVLPGWSLFRPYLPHAVWQWVDLRYAPTLQGFVNVILAANAAIVIGMLLEWWRRLRRDRALEV